jgi:hypothetical protein
MWVEVNFVKLFEATAIMCSSFVGTADIQFLFRITLLRMYEIMDSVQKWKKFSLKQIWIFWVTLILVGSKWVDITK